MKNSMQIEIRNDCVELTGYVNVVARESRVLPSIKGKFIEQIIPKTFERALEKADNVNLFFNHKEDRKLGSTKEGNLELYEDNIGLHAKCTVYDPDVINKAKENRLTGWSFGFISNKDSWKDAEDGIQRRFIEDMDLLEVSVLDCTPAYYATSLEMRGEESFVKELRSEELNTIISDKTTKVIPIVDYSIQEKEIEFIKLRGGHRTW